MQKVTILVDAQNVYYTTKQAYHCGFDYNQFWQQVTKDRKLVKAIAFSCERGDKKQTEFQNILRAIGFEVKLKSYIQRSDGSSKCDWDVGITIDALKYAEQSDIIVLVSGDGDFALLADTLCSDYKTFVEVYGVPKLTAASLVRSASKFIPIDNNLLLKQATRSKSS
ncbi:MAG: NYN domain-containing protein [Gammaproteobacteria bacterium]|nr:NYN domain-containing protein [Gammaproteobacteria bacterium]